VKLLIALLLCAILSGCSRPQTVEEKMVREVYGKKHQHKDTIHDQ